MKVQKSVTSRGFALRQFTDRYEKKCSLQKSSLATEDAIWLGIDDPAPMVMSVDAAAVGVKTDQSTGWVPFPISEKVSLHTRMHLTRPMVKKLLPMLQKFVDTGEL